MLPLRNLLRRKSRSLFALLQIAVAIAAFVSIVGVTKGLRAQFYLLGRVFSHDLILQPRGAASPLFSSIADDEAAVAAQVEGVAATSLLGLHLMRLPERPQPVTIMALAPGSELALRFRTVRGRALGPDDAGRCVIGELMATELGLAPGDALAFEGGEALEVVGTFEPPVKDVPFLAGQAIMTLDHYRDHFRLRPKLLVAHTRTGGGASSPDEVRRALARGAEVAPRLDAALPRLQARTIEAFLDSFKQAELVDAFTLAISLLAALVSAIGVANTMLMSVFDRTREIGLLRAVGWSRARIVSMIEAEGLLLALGGGLLGLPLGLALIALAKRMIGLGWLDVRLDLPLYAQAVGFACLIGVVGSLYPALRASWLEPTEALRYE